VGLCLFMCCVRAGGFVSLCLFVCCVTAGGLCGYVFVNVLCDG
jgi:hypothetical protein